MRNKKIILCVVSGAIWAMLSAVGACAQTAGIAAEKDLTEAESVGESVVSDTDGSDGVLTFVTTDVINPSASAEMSIAEANKDKPNGIVFAPKPDGVGETESTTASTTALEKTTRANGTETAEVGNPHTGVELPLGVAMLALASGFAAVSVKRKD
jgi:hypothetical protein